MFCYSVSFLTWVLYKTFQINQIFPSHKCAFPLLLKVFSWNTNIYFTNLWPSLMKLLCIFLFLPFFSLLFVKITFCVFLSNMSYRASNSVCNFYFIEWLLYSCHCKLCQDLTMWRSVSFTGMKLDFVHTNTLTYSSMMIFVLYWSLFFRDRFASCY